VLLFFPLLATAHPGKTDSEGCHVCRTNCDKYGILYNERHCHSSGSASAAPEAVTPTPTPLPTVPSSGSESSDQSPAPSFSIMLTPIPISSPLPSYIATPSPILTLNPGPIHSPINMLTPSAIPVTQTPITTVSPILIMSISEPNKESAIDMRENNQKVETLEEDLSSDSFMELLPETPKSKPGLFDFIQKIFSKIRLLGMVIKSLF